MSGSTIASVVILVTVLAFVVRELSGHRLTAGRKLGMITVWVAIFVALALLLKDYHP